LSAPASAAPDPAGGDVCACEGAPRDLGFDQGRACREALRADFARLPWRARLALRLGRRAGGAARSARDLTRHFPHAAEALAGLALGAGVPRAWLFALHAAGAAEPDGRALALAPEAGGPLLARCVPADAVTRRGRPEGGFACVAVTRPWLPASLAGVNEVGLAAAVLCERPAGPEEACTAPAVLLADACLRRFESAEAAADWCTRRPSGGRARLLFADAAGVVLSLALAPRGASLARPAEGVACAGPGLAPSDVAKRLHESFEPRPVAAARAVADARGRAVLLDPGARRLGRLHADGTADWVGFGA